MKVRHLRIRINTEKGLHGTDITFPDGLVILRADNSMGKSTCIQSILVGLGLEAMITTNQRDLPLPHVMKEELYSNSDLIKVLETDIFLELENKNAERVVVQRTIKGNRNKDLITVTYGPALTDNSRSYNSEDFFVSRAGSATREKGFHRFLAEFLDWNLPQVQTYDGNEVPLYIQCIFPFILVEQKRGWSSLIPPIPTQYRIREPHKRAVEFLLNLDAYAIAAKRAEINSRIKELENEWNNVVREARAIVDTIGGIVKRLPEKPISTWPPEFLPIIQLPYENNWLSLEELIDKKKLELRTIMQEEIPIVREVVQISDNSLSETQEKIRAKEIVLSQLLNSLEMERGETRSLQKRLEKIEEDIQRSRDLRTLNSLGSSIAPNISKLICPTCHQHIEDTLAPIAEDQRVMSIEDNIAFLEEQRQTFRAALRNANDFMDARISQITQLRTEITNERAKVRALRETLVSDERLPSIEAIRKRVELEEFINRETALLELFENKIGRFEPLSEMWLEIQKEKESLPDEDISQEDREKLKQWNKSVSGQLVSYGFKSLSPDSIIISEDTYIPTHEGFDLPSNISASDFIRIIWSYLNGLLEVSRDFNTNHPGLLIYDEPKQQSANDLSFAALLGRMSEARKYDQQVIFATSENIENLQRILANIPHKFIKFDGRIIQPLY